MRCIMGGILSISYKAFILHLMWRLTIAIENSSSGLISSHIPLIDQKIVMTLLTSSVSQFLALKEANSAVVSDDILLRAFLLQSIQCDEFPDIKLDITKDLDIKPSDILYSMVSSWIFILSFLASLLLFYLSPFELITLTSSWQFNSFSLSSVLDNLNTLLYSSSSNSKLYFM